MKLKRGALWLVLGLLVILGCSPVSVFAAPDVSFPRPQGLVNDFASVIPADEENSISQIAAGLWQQKGIELAVVTVSGTAPLDLNTYAFRLFRDWGIGDSQEHKGLLVLMDMQTRSIRIEVGLGLEGVINDAKAGRVLDKAAPELQAGRYGAALITITQELSSQLDSLDSEGKPLFGIDPQMQGIAGVIGAYFFLIIFAAIFRQHWLLHLLLRLPLMFMRGGRGGGGSFGGFGGGKSGGGGASRRF